MEEDKESPSSFTTKSFDEVETIRSRFFDLSKKRKLQPAELIDLPIPKHTCLGRGSAFQAYPESEQLPEIVTAKAADEGICSEHSSAEGSNGYMEDSESSIMPVPADSLSTAPTSTETWSLERHTYSSDSVAADNMESRTEDDINSISSASLINLQHILEEQLLEFKAHSYYTEHDAMETSGDNGTDDIMYSDHVNENGYVLSSGSGRWTIERDTQANTRKPPTIDKEFEQYFSMLMM